MTKEETMKLPRNIELELLFCAKGVIFTDLDGVWFDEENNFAPPIPSSLEMVKKAQKQGYVFVLNSDTGADALASFRQELGFTGPVIAENGAVIGYPSKKEKEYLALDLRSVCRKIQTGFIDEIRFQSPERGFFIGDATQFIRLNNRLSTANPIVYLVNTARECSIGIYTRKVNNDGSLGINDSLTQRTQEILQTLIPSASQLICKRYPLIGSCLVKNPKIVKTQGIKALLPYIPNSTPCWMIGNAIADSMQEIPRITTCAVGNADLKLKEIVLASLGIQAPDELTISNGAQYIIEQILKKERK